MPEKDAVPHDASSEQSRVSGKPASERELSEAELSAELGATRDRLLRAVAEQENIRLQARRDRDDAVRYAAAGFAGDLLSSVDNLERAIASVPEDKRSEPTIAALLTGVEATLRGLLDTFPKHGLRRLDPVGEPFDPHRHDASFEATDPQHPPGTVMRVIQPGYMHHERLLRPALVGVSKAPDPPGKDAPVTDDGTSHARDALNRTPGRSDRDPE
jgi:molecular chaperone GrpE